MRIRLGLYSIFIVLGGLEVSVAATAWDESVDGSLSTDPNEPTLISWAPTMSEKRFQNCRGLARGLAHFAESSEQKCA